MGINLKFNVDKLFYETKIRQGSCPIVAKFGI